jgi:hypothetical protein
VYLYHVVQLVIVAWKNAPSMPLKRYRLLWTSSRTGRRPKSNDAHPQDISPLSETLCAEYARFGKVSCKILVIVETSNSGGLGSAASTSSFPHVDYTGSKSWADI